MEKKKYPKLTPRERDLASEYIAEEVRTGKYPRAQAIAIGISRARAEVKKQQIHKQIKGILHEDAATRRRNATVETSTSIPVVIRQLRPNAPRTRMKKRGLVAQLLRKYG